jgi:hypothetical protein
MRKKLYKIKNFSIEFCQSLPLTKVKIFIALTTGGYIFKVRFKIHISILATKL